MKGFGVLRILPYLVLAACSWAEAPDRLRQDAERHHQRLIQEGFHNTFRFSWDRRRSGTLRRRFWLARSPAGHRLSLWFETRADPASIRIKSRGGGAVIALSGRRGERVLDRRLPPGPYTLEVDSEAAAGRVVFGVKGPMVQDCGLDPARTRTCPAAPAKGFHWPYLLYLPERPRPGPLLVVPINTGFPAQAPGLLRAAGACAVERWSGLAGRLGCPMLVPLFPRPRRDGGSLYLHALSRDSLLVRSARLRRVDLQLLGMLRDAQAQLGARGLEVGPKHLFLGFSAAGAFVNRFAMLHPAQVLAVACGAPGWPVAPRAVLDGEELRYPVGIADLERLSARPTDWSALRAVAWFFFQGGQDGNDPVPHRDSFSRADEERIGRRFGATPVSRWPQAERLYRTQGLRARFELYPEAGHEVTPGMEADLAAFFQALLDENGAGGRREPKGGAAPSR